MSVDEWVSGQLTVYDSSQILHVFDVIECRASGWPNVGENFFSQADAGVRVNRKAGQAVSWPSEANKAPELTNK
jgi:hypothetical protein